MSTPLNPYQAPTTRDDDVSDSANPQAESIRKEHINHEVSIKPVGTLYYLSTLGLAVAGLMTVFSTAAFVRTSIGGAVVGAVMVVMAAVFFIVERGVRSLVNAREIARKVRQAFPTFRHQRGGLCRGRGGRTHAGELAACGRNASCHCRGSRRKRAIGAYEQPDC